MMLGAPSWGIVADKFGRKPTLVWATLFLFWYGTLSSASPSFGWILALRFFVGVFIGAVPQVSFSVNSVTSVPMSIKIRNDARLILQLSLIL